MQADRLRELLEGVKAGQVTPDEAMASLKSLPFEDLGFANLDHHRGLRTGVPEVVFCQGKALPHIVEIVRRLREQNGHVLATRASQEVHQALLAAGEPLTYHEMARIVEVGVRHRVPDPEEPFVLVVSAGTADLPVAEEAAVTAEALGSRVERLYDVGVAGIHRLLSRTQQLYAASAVIVAAGMEGALASVVGGLVSAPVIALPTSVGYGASFGGLAALLTMLNTCASGVATVNIDNGFGAGYYAHIILTHRP
ncbi:MAG TPA: nickel pincer cofactor biosynthesis protein LarB [Armatimonadota bacterium]|jgi:hypothetical protein